MPFEQPVRLSRTNDFAVIMVHKDEECVDTLETIPPLLQNLRERLDGFAASVEPKFCRVTTVIGVGSNFGAEALILKGMATVNTVVDFGKNVWAALRFAKNENRRCHTSEPALQAYIQAWLQAVFPQDFPANRGCQINDVVLTRVGSDGGEGDSAFGWSFYGFVATGSGCHAAGYISCDGSLVGDVILSRTRVDYQIYSAQQVDPLALPPA